MKTFEREDLVRIVHEVLEEFDGEDPLEAARDVVRVLDEEGLIRPPGGPQACVKCGAAVFCPCGVGLGT